MSISGRKIGIAAERINLSIEYDPNGGCWLWSGAIKTVDPGRPLRGILTRNGKRILAHRFSYQTFVGPLKPGKMICHKCDVSLCVNPDHLYQGTAKDNFKDMVDRKRAGWMTNPKAFSEGWKKGGANGKAPGSKNGRAIIDENQALEILRSEKKNREMADLYGLNISTVRHIRARRIWKHLVP